MEFLVDTFFFSTMNVSPRGLLKSKVSNDKSDNFIQNPLYIIPHFTFIAFKILSFKFLFSLSFSSMTVMDLNVGLFEFMPWGIY